MAELNPNHAVTSAMREQWHTIVALLMLSRGERTVVISPDEVARALADPLGINVTIKINDVTGITLKLVDDVEAERLARKEGGLPT